MVRTRETSEVSSRKSTSRRHENEEVIVASEDLRLRRQGVRAGTKVFSVSLRLPLPFHETNEAQHFVIQKRPG